MDPSALKGANLTPQIDHLFMALTRGEGQGGGRIL